MKKVAAAAAGVCALSTMAATAFALANVFFLLVVVTIVMAISFFQGEMDLPRKGPKAAGKVKISAALDGNSSGSGVVRNGFFEFAGDFHRTKPKADDQPGAFLDLMVPLKDNPEPGAIKFGGNLTEDDIGELGMLDEISDALNQMLQGFNEDNGGAGAKPNFQPGGDLRVTDASGKGSASVDKKTFTKFKSRIQLNFEGVVDDGPNQGMAFKGTFKVKAKGNADDRGF